MSSEHMQIGEVADRVQLSLRTIRYYDEVGLVRPSARSGGGFRLYAEADVARLRMIKRMKSLEFTLEEMQDLLAVLDQLESGDDTPLSRDMLLDRLVLYRMAAAERHTALLDQLATVETFSADLDKEITRQRRMAEPPRG